MEVKMRKMVALILCIYMCVTSLSVEAKSKKTSGKDGANITWNYDKQTKTLTFSGNGAISDFEMDGHIDEPEWYDWSEQAEHIVVEEGITVIGKMTFYDFMNVSTVNLPETVKKIEKSAFDYDLELKTINFPRGLEYIGKNAFGSCNRIKVNQLPETVKKIGKGAFEDCYRIKRFIFPVGIELVNDEVLAGNKSLCDVKLPDNTKIILGGAFYNCKRLTEIYIPKSVVRVAMSAFAGTGLKKIVLPAKIERIDNGDFGSKVFQKKVNLLPTKNLRVIEIHSKKVKKIERNSFGGLSSKVVIKVPKSKKKKYTKMLRKSGLSEKVKVKSL